MLKGDVDTKVSLGSQGPSGLEPLVGVVVIFLHSGRRANDKGP